MAATSSSSSIPLTLINRIEINFDAKEKEANRILEDPIILGYALEALEKIRPCSDSQRKLSHTNATSYPQ